VDNDIYENIFALFLLLIVAFIARGIKEWWLFVVAIVLMGLILLLYVVELIYFIKIKIKERKKMKKFVNNFKSRWNDIDDLQNLHKRLKNVENYLEEKSDKEPQESCLHKNLKRGNFYTVKSTDHPVYQCTNEECKTIFGKEIL
jgi:energy-coupling factor transporter transmembrane protein EcfT